MTTITKKDIVDRIARDTNTPKSTATLVVQCFLDELIVELGRDNRLEFRDFGVFEVKHRAARMAQNPKTKEPVRVPPGKTVRFKPGKELKHRLSGGWMKNSPK